ncbi:MAG TPA: LamG domain-containing protein [Candidatus Paceibacterota bacterium]|nr:LamG domain-containing protein [Verrucomicrobiota bacterium]HRZ47486.1 LamG domain-containing protein [Candidatus Paceibacterota bacterium]
MIKSVAFIRAAGRALACLAVALTASWLAAGTSRAADTLAQFEFNEGTGRTISSTVNGLVGSLGVPVIPTNQPIATTDSPSAAAGDTAVQLQGVGFLVNPESAANNIFNLRTDEFTLEAWIKTDPTDTRVNEGIIAYGGMYKLGMNNAQLRFTLYGIVDIDSGIYITPGVWTHVASIWVPGTGVTFYVNGGFAAGGYESVMANTNQIRALQNYLLSIGSEGTGNPIMGALDRVRIHKAVLTPDQLDYVAATPKAPLASTLAAYNFSETGMPFQSAVEPARPLTSYEEYRARITEASFTTDTPSGLEGDFALQFGSGQYCVIPDPSVALSLDTSNPSFTIQAWVKFSPQNQLRSVLFQNNCPGGALSFSVTTDRRVFVTTLGIVDQTSTAFVPDDGQWHHIAVVHEHGVAFRFYVDGVLRDTRAYNRGVVFDRTGTVFYLGSEAGGNPYIGKLDRFRYSKGVVPVEELDCWPVPGQTTVEVTAQTPVLLSWPAIPAGYILQKSYDLNEPRTNWVDVTTTPVSGGGKFYVAEPLTSPKAFYRVVKP